MLPKITFIIHISSFTTKKMDFRFRRTERLKSEKVISLLFKKGQSFSCYPLRLVYMEIPSVTKSEDSADLSPIQFSLTVPKKSFKHAVDRNLLRRRIREAYRLNKSELYLFLQNNPEFSEKQFAFMVIYTAKETLPYDEIQKGIRKMVVKFKDALGK